MHCLCCNLGRLDLHIKRLDRSQVAIKSSSCSKSATTCMGHQFDFQVFVHFASVFGTNGKASCPGLHLRFDPERDAAGILPGICWLKLCWIEKSRHYPDSL